MTFLIDLRQASARSQYPTTSARLSRLAQELGQAIHDLNMLPTADALKTVNGLWASGVKAIYDSNEENKRNGAA